MKNKYIYNFRSLIYLAIFSAFFQVLVIAQKTKPVYKQNDYRYLAILSLENSLEEARKIEDLTLRIKLTQKIVKLIRKTSADKCKKAVDRLFEEVIDEKTSKPKDDNFKEKIGQIIKTASIIDTDFAEKYIERYKALIEDENEPNVKEQDKRTQAQIYLYIASELLETNPSLSAQIAENSLRIGIFYETFVYLSELKVKSALLSENLISKSLSLIKIKKAPDVNELFILYAFVFNTASIPSMNSGNSVYYPIRFSGINELAINQQLAESFIQTSLKLISNPQRLNPDQTKHGVLGDFFFLKILAPFVSRYIPAAQNDLVNLQIVLSNYLNPENRDSISNSADSLNLKDKGEDKLNKEYWLEKAEKVKSNIEKDSCYFEAAKITMKQMDFSETLKIIDLIKDEAIQDFVMYQVGRKTIEVKNFDETKKIIKKIRDITGKISLFVYSAKYSLKGGDSAFVNQNLNEAETLLNSVNDYEKVSAQFAIASVYINLDDSKTIQILDDGFATSNKTIGFSNEFTVSRSFKVNSFTNFYNLFDEQMKPVYFLPKLSAKNFLILNGMIAGLKNTAFKIENQTAVCSPIFALK